MTTDYSILLENLHGRRYDEALRESIVSEAFEECDYADCIRYTLEAMQEVEPSYTYKSFHIAKRIQDKIEAFYSNRGVKIDFRYQGAIQTETHLRLYGGIELVVIKEILKGEDDWQVVEKLGLELMGLLGNDSNIKTSEFNSKHKINLTTTKPESEITILPAVWLENKKYQSTKREIDRGICEFNFKQKTRRKYLPFLNIARVNARDARCNGGLKRMVRLIRSIQRDSAEKIQLNHYEISSILFDIPAKQMIYNPKKALSLLGVVSAQLNRTITDKKYRREMLSPSQKEFVFGQSDQKVGEIQKLKLLLDKLIMDLKVELKNMKKTIYSEIIY